MTEPAGTPGTAPVPARGAELDPRQRIIEVIDRALTSALSTTKEVRWTGTAVSVFGTVLIGLAFVFEEVGTRLTTTDFVAVIIVGALLTLAGPLMLVNTNLTAQRTVSDAVNAEYEYRQRLPNSNDGQQ